MADGDSDTFCTTHVVRVRNTFLDIAAADEDGVPEQPGFRRTQSEPGAAPAIGASPPRDAGVPGAIEEGEEEEGDEADEDFDEDAPPPPPLCRWVTQDGFENLTDWQWPQDEPRPELPPTPPPSPPPATSQGQFFGYAPVNYMPVPVMPMQFVPAQAAAPFPQPMRGVRWPEENGRPAVPFQTGVQQPGIPLDVEQIEQMKAATADMHANMPGGVMAVPMQPGLERQFSVNSQIHRLHWTIPEKKLRASDKVAVSSLFEIFGASWRLMLQPHVTHSHKGGASFKTAKGWATIKLKCEDRKDIPSLTMMFRFFAGSLLPRGPATHDFTLKNIGALSSNEFWNLLPEVKDGTVTLGAEVWQLGAT